jgi:hypothetical protein
MRRRTSAYQNYIGLLIFCLKLQRIGADLKMQRK